MQYLKFILLVPALVLAISLVGLTSDADAAPKKPKAKGKLRHVVCFKFKESASKKQIDELVQAFGDLKGKIKEMKTFEWGTNVSPEQHDKGFTHCFISTFKTAKDRDTYLVHPAHKEFVKLVPPIVDDVFVVDFWAQ